MKMPHADSHNLLEQQSPHVNRNEDQRTPGNRKMPADDEMTSRHDNYSSPQDPHRAWRQHQQALNDLSNVPPPVSPHAPPPEYASYEYPYYHAVSHGPTGSRGSGAHGGYSYYHHYPYGPPPPTMPPIDNMPPRHDQNHSYYPPSPHHYRSHYPDGATSSPLPPHYTSPPRYPHPSPPPPPHYYAATTAAAAAAATPEAPPSSYYDYHANFIPPSTSMTSTGSTAEEDYSYGHHRYEALSPHSATSTASPAVGPEGNEVNEVMENDVLCGRGAPTNYHQGNEYFRELVKQYQGQYLASKRADKPFIASHVVSVIQSRGGRFLRRYKRSGASTHGHFVWVEVEPQKAYEKACQALREGAPEIRRKMQASSGGSCAGSARDEEEAEQPVAGRKKSATESCSDRNNNDDSVQTQQPGDERLQESNNEDTKKTPSPAKDANEDDRNDDMEDSERS